MGLMYLPMSPKYLTVPVKTVISPPKRKPEPTHSWIGFFFTGRFSPTIKAIKPSTAETRKTMRLYFSCALSNALWQVSQ